MGYNGREKKYKKLKKHCEKIFTNNVKGGIFKMGSEYDIIVDSSEGSISEILVTENDGKLVITHK